jgi:hypothetical protein
MPRLSRNCYTLWMLGDRKWGGGTVLVLAVLLGMLGLAIYVGVAGWNMGADSSGESMSTSGYVAMAFGIVVTLALGAGLMALMYYSSRNDRD